MSALFPKYISRDELLTLLQQETATLGDSDLVWWRQHSIAPFPVRAGEALHFVVAVSGRNILFFADDEDEFGFAKLESGSQVMTDFGLAGDLQDAIRGIRHVGA